MILAMAAATATLSPEEAAAAKNRADLQMMYDQSCAVRAYGSYDDMCAKLAQSIKVYDRDQAKLARERARNPRLAPPPASAPAPDPVAAAPAAQPAAAAPPPSALSLNGK